MQISGFSGMQQMQQQMFKQADTDGSGGLSKAEFTKFGETMKANAPAGMQAPSGMSSADQMFSKLDADGNGELMQSEMDAGRPQLSSDIMSALLQLQEDDGSGGGLASLLGSSGSGSDSASLIQQILDQLNQATEEQTSSLATSA